MTVKQGGHRLFERDPETARVVSDMLLALEKRDTDAVREYSGSLDGWTPPSLELSAEQIRGAMATLDRQAIEDTTYCQGNVRAFARAQLAVLPTREAASLSWRDNGIGEVTERQCIRENMLAHAITVRVRVERYGGGRQ